MVFQVDETSDCDFHGTAIKVLVSFQSILSRWRDDRSQWLEKVYVFVLRCSSSELRTEYCAGK